MQEMLVWAQQKSEPEFSMPPKLDDATDTERVQIVAPSSWIQRVEEWRRNQARIPSRSEAIRILVDLALEREAKKERRS
jgi:hypothetical protein